MSTGAGAPSKGSVKTKPKPTVPSKQYTELLFEYSDGKGHELSALQASENNAKLTLDPDAQTRWEIGLGAALKLNCGSVADKTIYMARFPKGFNLIFDPKRGDRYVVGHPGGMSRDFWYRNVAEFAPHLFWLGTPTPHDRARCSCEPCKKMLGQPKPKETKKAAVKRKQSSGSVGTSKPTAFASSDKPSTTGAKPTPKPAAVVVPPKPVLLPAQDNSIYRVGEMVWFSPQVNVWRIGVITARSRDNLANPDLWTITPLGHAALQATPSIKEAASMRPFLAFSLPDIELEAPIRDQKFADVNWLVFVQQYAGSDTTKKEQAGLEASKMAAKDVNCSFSTFNRLGSLSADGRRGSYGGAFLGPEMIRVGDAIRVSRHIDDQDDPDVMEIKHIIDDETGGRLEFHGDVWRMQVVGADEPPPSAQQPQGASFTRQADTYNEVLRVAGGRLDWVLIENGSQRVEGEVLGRFYVSFDLLPELRARVQTENSFEDGMKHLNPRLRNDNEFYIGRVASRRAAFGESIGVVKFDLDSDIVEG